MNPQILQESMNYIFEEQSAKNYKRLDKIFEEAEKFKREYIEKNSAKQEKEKEKDKDKKENSDLQSQLNIQVQGGVQTKSLFKDNEEEFKKTA